MNRNKYRQTAKCLQQMHDGRTPEQLTNEGYASGCVEAARVLFEQGIQRPEQNTQERLDSALREAGE